MTERKHRYKLTETLSTVFNYLIHLFRHIPHRERCLYFSLFTVNPLFITVHIPQMLLFWHILETCISTLGKKIKYTKCLMSSFFHPSHIQEPIFQCCNEIKPFLQQKYASILWSSLVSIFSMYLLTALELIKINTLIGKVFLCSSDHN